MPQTIPNYDASFCGRLPLHQTNLIQPHGVLFVLHPQSFEILQVSENVSAFPGLLATALAGTSFQQVVDADSFNQLAQAMQGAGEEKQTLNLEINTGQQAISCSALAHLKSGVLFVEVLLPQATWGSGRSFLQAYQEIKTIVTALNGQEDLSGFASTVAREMRRLSGFDKVMVYSFNAEWHGTVLAEEKVPEMDSYLHLRFPASDIPKPAREMYLKNPYRFIPDRDYEPAKLYPLLNPGTHGFSDLSGCDLRSVAGVHLEYMKNMQITASLSLRLVHQGKLWGLISCHHRTARFLSFETLGLFELLSNIFSAQLSLLLNDQQGQKHQKLQEQLTALVPRLHAGPNLQQSLVEHAASIQELLGAEGIAFNLDGQINTYGTVPDANDLDQLFYWLQVQDTDAVIHQPSLPRVFEEAASFAPVGSGLLALPVVPGQGSFLVAFRPEALQEVAWGGNPYEALQLEPDGKMYHPRHSFSIWKQTVQQTARPWDEAEITTAETLKNVLAGIVLRRMHA